MSKNITLKALQCVDLDKLSLSELKLFCERYLILTQKYESDRKTILFDNPSEIAEGLVKSHPDFKEEGLSEYQNGRFNGIIEGLGYINSRNK
jgi:hypothetical protein